MNNQEMEQRSEYWRCYCQTERQVSRPIDQGLLTAMMADAWLMVKEIVGALVDLTETVHDKGL